MRDCQLVSLVSEDLTRQLKELVAETVPRERLTPPPGEDFWVFGYGSLMWHPGFPHVEVRLAVLHGYHRRFCVYSHRYRGTPERPGLVLGLDRGGSCRGLAFRVPAAESAEVIDYLYEREMITGVYIPRWFSLETEALLLDNVEADDTKITHVFADQPGDVVISNQ